MYLSMYLKHDKDICCIKKNFRQNSTHWRTHEFTVQGRDDSREQSVSSIPSTEPETLQASQASVSTALQSASHSSNLPKAPSTTSTSATPVSTQSSPFLKPAQDCADVAEEIVDDVFSTIDEVLSAQDSSHKEFHSAVLRALSKEPAVVEAAEADQAPGTPDEVESCFFCFPPPCSASAHLAIYHCTGRRGNPCLLCPLFFLLGWESAAFVLPPYPQSRLLKSFAWLFFYPPPFSDVSYKGIRDVAV